MKTSNPFVRGLRLILVGIVAAACNLVNPESGVSPGRGTSGGDDGRKEEASPASGGRLLTAAVGFPADYDWKRDTAASAVRGASVLLLHGTDTLLCIPAGAGTSVGTSPDMIHYMGGHLYTEYSDAASTVLCRDGVEILRFGGREMLRGIMPVGDLLYTLWQPRSGAGGFCLRRDGEILYMRSDGRVAGAVGDAGYGPCGALYEDRGEVVFGFFRDSVTGDPEVYLYRAGKAGRVAVPTGVSQVYDVRQSGGSIYLAGALETGEKPVMARDADICDLSDGISEERIYSMQLFPRDGRVGLIGCYRQVYSGHARGKYFDLYCTGIWDGGDGTLADVGSRPPGIFFGEGYVCSDGSRTVFVRTHAGRLFDITEHNTDHLEPPDGYTLCGSRCTLMRGGRLYLALTSAEGGPPAIWNEGEVVEVPINGCLAGIYSE